MAEKIFDLLKLAYRQRFAIYRVGDMFTALFKGGFSFRRIAALVIAIAEMFSVTIFDGAMTPFGEELNLDGYSLVFCDEFDGDALNTDVWNYRGSGPRRYGYNSDSQVKVEDGKLVITGEYLENGEFGPGWYVGMINLKQYYCQGYFEIKCKCNSGDDFWSAFWIQADHPYDHNISAGGKGGAEIDIFESLSSDGPVLQRGAVTQTIHCNGTDDDEENIDSRNVGKFKGNNIYNEYNTYGVKWTEDEYIFYVNGVETARSDFGVSQVPEMVIVSLEIPDNVSFDVNSGYKTTFDVDYVKIWQQT